MGKNQIPPQPIVTGFFPCHPLPPTFSYFLQKASSFPIKSISLGIEKSNC
jgi:hypothetical protein